MYQALLCSAKDARDASRCITCVLRAAGVENNGVLTRVGTFPIGIDPERFTRALESEEVQSHTAKLLNRYAGRKVGRQGYVCVMRIDTVPGVSREPRSEVGPWGRGRILRGQGRDLGTCHA